MNYYQALELVSGVDDTASPDDLFELWFIAERSLPFTSDDFEKDCKLEPYRDNLSAHQNMLARRLLDTQATSLKHILNKLLLWECVCGPNLDQNAGISEDTYSSMICSAIEDLRVLIPS